MYLEIALLLLLATMIFAVLRGSASTKAKLALSRVTVFCSPLLLAMFFYVYQTLTVGSLTYYYVKSSYMGYYFVILALGASITWGVTILAEDIGRLRALTFGLLIVMILGMYLSLTKTFLQYTKDDNVYASSAVLQAESTLVEKGIQPKDIVSYTGRIYEEDMILNLFNSAVDPFTPIPERRIAYEAQMKQYPQFFANLSRYSRRQTTTTYILASSRTLPTLQRKLPAKGNYQLVMVND